MELTVNLNYDEVVKLIKQLPASKIKQLKLNLDDKFISSKASKEISNFQKFLLECPIMSNKQYLEFKENRKLFDQWRRIIESIKESCYYIMVYHVKS
jgi:hypothetical protein